MCVCVRAIRGIGDGGAYYVPACIYVARACVCARYARISNVYIICTHLTKA